MTITDIQSTGKPDSVQDDSTIPIKLPAKVRPAVVTKEPKPPKPERIVKNGIKLPNAGTSGAQCWGIADKVQKANPKFELKELRKLVIEEGVKAGVKKSQMSAETSSWSKFNKLR